MNWQDEALAKERSSKQGDGRSHRHSTMVGDEADSDPIIWTEPESLPSGATTVEPFDEHLLPEVFRPWIMDISERLQCPPDFPAVAMMVVLAGIVGRKIGIRPQRHTPWLVVPNLWGAVIGRPGLMKSPALAEPLKILRCLEATAKQEYEAAVGDYETSLIVAKATRDVRQKDLKSAIRNGDNAELIAAELQSLEDPEPSRRRYLVNDGTVEKLGEILSANSNGVVVFRDELTGFLKSLDKDGAEGSRSFYLEAWNGNDSFTFDRIGRGTVDIPAAIISIIGGIQPGPLGDYLRKAAAGGAGDDGLLQRFQLAVWPDNPRTWRNVDRLPDGRAKQAVHETCERLEQMQSAELGTERDHDDVIPYLRFASEAQNIFDNWREMELEPRIRAGDEHPAIEAHLAKYRSLVPSLALLCHLADEPKGGPVSLDAIKRAIAWARYLESHARRMYGEVVNRSNGSAKALARKLLDGKLKDGFTLRDVYRAAWSQLSSREDAQDAVDVLCDHDWLTSEMQGAGNSLKEVFRINPRIFEMPQTTN